MLCCFKHSQWTLAYPTLSYLNTTVSRSACLWYFMTIMALTESNTSLNLASNNKRNCPLLPLDVGMTTIFEV